jgi:hypothetical protein
MRTTTPVSNLIKDLKEYTFVCNTVASRDFIIQTIYGSDWDEHMTEGFKLLCKANQEGQGRNAFNREWTNSVHYNFIREDEKCYILKEVDGDGKGIYIPKPIFKEYFQPYNVICCTKGQDTDYKDVVYYIDTADIRSCYKQLFYMCATRARENFTVLVDDRDSETVEQRERTIAENIAKIIDADSFVRPFSESYGSLDHLHHIEAVMHFMQLHEKDILREITVRGVYNNVYLKKYIQPQQDAFNDIHVEDVRNNVAVGDKVEITYMPERTFRRYYDYVAHLYPKFQKRRMSVTQQAELECLLEDVNYIKFCEREAYRRCQ